MHARQFHASNQPLQMSAGQDRHENRYGERKDCHEYAILCIASNKNLHLSLTFACYILTFSEGAEQAPDTAT